MNEASPSRTRPLGETAGRPQRPSGRRTGPARSFDLAQEVTALQQEETWHRSGRNARTLIEEPGLRVVLTMLQAGTRIPEHRTSGWVVIQTLKGYIRVQSPEETLDLVMGRLLALEPGVAHDVEAIEQSVFLLTIVPPTAASSAPSHRPSDERAASPA
jgi:quercetin dioxygenase-like cupin family protein